MCKHRCGLIHYHRSTLDLQNCEETEFFVLESIHDFVDYS